MKQKIQEILTEYNEKFAKMFGEKIKISTDVPSSPELRSISGAAAFKPLNLLILNIKKSEELKLFFHEYFIKEAESLKEDPIFKQFSDFNKEIKAAIKNSRRHLKEDLTPEEVEIFLKYTIAHELAHIYFPNKNNPSYPKEINLLSIREQSSPIIADIRDEIRSEVLAILFLKEDYQNSKLFQNTLQKIADGRLLGIADNFVNRNIPHIFFHLYKDNQSFFKNLNISKENLPEIEKQVDDITLKTVERMGIILSNPNLKDSLTLLKESIIYINNALEKICSDPNDPFGSRSFYEELNLTIDDCLKEEFYQEHLPKKLEDSNGLSHLDEYLKKIPVADNLNNFDFKDLIKTNQLKPLEESILDDLPYIP